VATCLICSTPVHGHVSPMVAIGADLVARGNRVVMLTGSRFEQRVLAAGMEFRALGGNADFDDRDVASYLPDRANYKPGIAQAQYDIKTMFVATIPAQLTAVRDILAADAPDAILVDTAFVGTAPLVLDPDAQHPPVLAVGVLPLAQSSVDVAPSGMGLPPASGVFGRLRNRVLNVLGAKVLFRDTQKLAEQMFAEVGAPPLKHFVMDVSTAYERFLQLNAPAFEYPRSDLSPNTLFVGPIPAPASEVPLPDWWGDLDGSRPVVHVSQGTIDNHDLTRLIRPTLDALADRDVLVVVSTGGRDPGELGDVPANARVARYLPYGELFPLLDVFVTNGGFGGVQLALAAGGSRRAELPGEGAATGRRDRILPATGRDRAGTRRGGGARQPSRPALQYPVKTIRALGTPAATRCRRPSAASDCSPAM
jgi:UDP:flavonoid glycosyltransferase YjiC (YdhE family)